MDHKYTASFGRVKLQPLSAEDSQKYRMIRNRDENRCRFVFSDIIEEEAQCRWYMKYIVTPNDYMFSIYNADNQFIGGNALYNIDLTEHTGEFGRLLIDKEKCKSHNWGFEATMSALKIAFDALGLIKVYLEVYADNVAAYRTYLKAGFMIDGRKKDCNGKEMLMMELVNPAKTNCAQ